MSSNVLMNSGGLKHLSCHTPSVVANGLDKSVVRSDLICCILLVTEMRSLCMSSLFCFGFSGLSRFGSILSIYLVCVHLSSVVFHICLLCAFGLCLFFPRVSSVPESISIFFVLFSPICCPKFSHLSLFCFFDCISFGKTLFLVTFMVYLWCIFP